MLLTLVKLDMVFSLHDSGSRFNRIQSVCPACSAFTYRNDIIIGCRCHTHTQHSKPNQISKADIMTQSNTSQRPDLRTDASGCLCRIPCVSQGKRTHVCRKRLFHSIPAGSCKNQRFNNVPLSRSTSAIQLQDRHSALQSRRSARYYDIIRAARYAPGSSRCLSEIPKIRSVCVHFNCINRNAAK